MTEVTSNNANAAGGAQSRRRHERVPTRGKVRACIKAPHVPEYEGEELAMEILEVSPAGLRIRSTDNLPQSEAIDLVATIDGYDAEIFLSTWVRWQEQDDEGCSVLGVEIEDNDASDLDTWCDFQREEWFKAKA
ncbi:MAG: PilZ domain-containing protein [Pseudomonadales bacterium]|jgi:hypothetical protein